MLDEDAYTADVLIGMAARSRILFVVVLVNEPEDVTRIISARKAVSRESKTY